jgi:hypothetical protein
MQVALRGGFMAGRGRTHSSSLDGWRRPPNAVEISKTAIDAVPPHPMCRHQHPTSLNTVTPDSDPGSRSWIPAFAGMKDRVASSRVGSLIQQHYAGLRAGDWSISGIVGLAICHFVDRSLVQYYFVFNR